MSSNQTVVRLSLLVLGLCTVAGECWAATVCDAVPGTMRAARIDSAGGPEALRIESIDVPRPQAGEVLVRVHYASVNPVDWKRQEAGRLPFPATPGGDLSGVVVAVGSGVQGWRCGDRVAGIADPGGRGGSYAEYAVVAVTDLVAKPARYSMAEAAAYPTVAVAAWRFLIEAGQVQAGERVLVQGGAGGVGSMVVQLAKSRGATVIATASARNHDYLRGLGADEVIDYREVAFETVVSDIDLVIDTVGGDTTLRSAAVLRDGGRLVTLVGRPPADLCADGRIRCPDIPPWNVAQGLAGVAPLIEEGRLLVHIDASYPLTAAAQAQQHNREGRTRGKIVIDMGVDDPVESEPDLTGIDPEVLVPLRAYLEGHATGSEAAFRRAFAVDAWLIGFRDGRYRQWPVSDYIAASASGRAPPDEARRRRVIRSVNVTGEVASAVIELDYPAMKALDHMSLLRFDDGWRIVAKTYQAWTP